MAQEKVLLGRGRSGSVYKEESPTGRPIARKVFLGDPLGKVVLHILTGAPNPYAWDSDAIVCAHERRQILGSLVSFWFGRKLKVMASRGYNWNTESSVYEMNTDFSSGRPPRLQHPLSNQACNEMKELLSEIMLPLQQNLKESGFIGLLWQAGLANPVATNNFLLETDGEQIQAWAWIDLESGVPALFPMNIINLFTFYLPQAIRRGAPLFDDVDTERLQQYIESNREALTGHLGLEGYLELCEQVNHLENHQQRWKGASRISRSIVYQLRNNSLTTQQAEWYRQHPGIWITREFFRGLAKLTRFLFVTLPGKAWRRLTAVPIPVLLKGLILFVVSEKYRSARAHEYFGQRIAAWEERGQLDGHSAEILRAQVNAEATTPYLTDFFNHAALKPVEMLFVTTVLPSMLIQGTISAPMTAFLALWGGSITRTIYTLLRMAGSLFQRGRKLHKASREHSFLSRLKATLDRRRFIALWVGIIPTLGNLAYPIQMLYSTSTQDQLVGKFMIYDICTRMGERFPIWGGRDTRTEHFFNNIADRIVRSRKPE